MFSLLLRNYEKSLNSYKHSLPELSWIDGVYNNGAVLFFDPTFCRCLHKKIRIVFNFPSALYRRLYFTWNHNSAQKIFCSPLGKTLIKCSYIYRYFIETVTEDKSRFISLIPTLLRRLALKWGVPLYFLFANKWFQISVFCGVLLLHSLWFFI